MRIQEYSTYEAYLNITVSSPRPEGVPSHIIPGAKLHDQIASQVRGLLREYKHVSPTSTMVSASASVMHGLPQKNGGAIYAVRTLIPAGSVVEVNEDYMLDVLRLRYAITFVLTSGALCSNEGLAFAFEENFQRAFKTLFRANELNSVFIPGDEDRRPGDRTEIDLILEVGGAAARLGYDVA